MKPTPKDWPRIASALCYQDAARAIGWLCDAFGFEVRLKVEGANGRIEHSELTYGEGLIMVSQEDLTSDRSIKRVLRSPRSLDGCGTQSLMFYVDDVDAHLRMRAPMEPASWKNPRCMTTATTTGPIAATVRRTLKDICGGSYSACEIRPDNEAQRGCTAGAPLARQPKAARGRCIALNSMGGCHA